MRLLILIPFLLLANATLGQVNTSDFSANIDIKANVIRSIELITVKSMDVTQAQPGQLEIVINPITDAAAGHMIAVGTADADIQINYFKDRELTRTDGPGVLVFTYEVSTNVEDNQGTSELIDDDSRVQKLNREGRLFLWVGGRINLERANPGTYEGDFTIEIDYI